MRIASHERMVNHPLAARVRGRVVIVRGNGPSADQVDRSVIERLRARGVVLAACNGMVPIVGADLGFAVDDAAADAMTAHPPVDGRMLVVQDRRVPPNRHDVVGMLDFPAGTSTGHGAAWMVAAAGALVVVLLGFDGRIDRRTIGEEAPERSHAAWASWLLVAVKNLPESPRWLLAGSWGVPHPLDELPAERVNLSEFESVVSALSSIAAYGVPAWPVSA